MYKKHKMDKKQWKKKKKKKRTKKKNKNKKKQQQSRVYETTNFPDSPRTYKSNVFLSNEICVELNIVSEKRMFPHSLGKNQLNLSQWYISMRFW